MPNLEDWERIRELGSGGQSTVYLVRNPRRVSHKEELLNALQGALSDHRADLLALGITEYAREDRPEEMGALKLFDKSRRGGAGPEERITRELEILQEGHKNLPKLLDGNASEKWMVTEYFPKGVMEQHPELFRGDALNGLKAFRPLVETVASLHRKGIIHRDIKPANVFVAQGTRLVLGDFGIAFRSNGAERITVTHERVGPWDYMPQWGDTGDMLEDVKPSFDIYMLGKLLWCMISGRSRLPREYHRRDAYDLLKIFPHDQRMHIVNTILDRCIVEHEDQCLKSADDLLAAIDDAVSTIDRRIFVGDNGELLLPCFICGRGHYREETKGGRVQLSRYNNNNVQESPIYLRSYCCDVCTHRAFFAPAFPEEAKKRNWKRLS